MSFWATFGASLATNLLGSKGGRTQAAPAQQVPQLNLGGYKRAVGRRGSQATKSRAAPVQMALGATACGPPPAATAWPSTQGTKCTCRQELSRTFFFLES